jgi:hypothetical protein
MKPPIFFLFAFALAGWGQLAHPQLGLMLDADGAVRPVYGAAASATLDDPVLDGVLSFGCSSQICLFKSAAAIIASDGTSATAPSGTAVFTMQGDAAYIYFPDSQQWARWRDGQLEWIDFAPDDAVPTATVMGLHDGSIVAAADHIALVRRDGSELDFAVAGVQRFFAMGKGYVQAVTDRGMWILRVEPGREQIFLLPGTPE